MVALALVLVGLVGSFWFVLIRFGCLGIGFGWFAWLAGFGFGCFALVDLGCFALVWLVLLGFVG